MILKAEVVKNNAPTKINCSKCGIEKELIFEKFYKNKNKKTGFESQCKDCLLGFFTPL